jgi:hypothetical protein
MIAEMTARVESASAVPPVCPGERVVWVCRPVGTKLYADVGETKGRFVLSIHAFQRDKVRRAL